MLRTGRDYHISMQNMLRTERDDHISMQNMLRAERDYHIRKQRLHVKNWKRLHISMQTW